MRMRTVVLWLMLLVAACDGPMGPPTTSTPPPPTIPVFSLFGQVRATSDAPLPGARVRVDGTATQVSSVVTDAEGRWTLPGLRGAVFLEAWKPGYFPATVCCPSSHDPLGVMIRLEQGERIAVGDTVPGSLGLGPQRCWEGLFEAACQVFLLTPQVSGLIEVAVTWEDPVDVLVTLSTLTFEASAPPAPRGRRTLVHSVTAGESYEVRVASVSNCRAYELKVEAR